MLSTALLLHAATAVANPAIVSLQQDIAIESLSAMPWQIRVSLYRNEDDAKPVVQQLFSADDWQTDRNLDEGLPESGGIRFRMRIEADESDGIHPGDTLWAETRVDGQAMGERFQVQAVTPPKFTIEGEIETRGATGGIRFPDNSFQDSASPLVSGTGASVALDMNNHGISNLPTPSNPGDAVSLSYLQTYLAANGDNLGDHRATANIKLDGNWLSGDGENEGIQVSSTGKVVINSSLFDSAPTLQVLWGDVLSGNASSAQNGRLHWMSFNQAFRAGRALGKEWDSAPTPLNGTATVVHGSTTVTGSGTAFQTELSHGDRIKVGGHEYVVSSITSDTELELVKPASSAASGALSIVRVGKFSAALGDSGTASGESSTALGTATKASGDVSTAIGNASLASGYVSTAMGIGTKASGEASVAIGRNAIASGYVSTAMGFQTIASGDRSSAMGLSTTASGGYSTAMGYFTTASGNASSAMGSSTEADDDHSLVIGQYNDTAGDNYFVVGNGADVSNRSNALVLTKSGNLGVGNPTPGNRMSFFGAPSDTWGDNRLAYVGLIKNTLTTNAHSGDVLALQTSATGNVTTAANFIGFFNAGGALIGQIEGNGSGGVAYNTTGADYAEYLPRKHPDESLEAGDVVGVYGGSITRDTRDADQVMVITDRAAVLGNAPLGRDDAQGYEAVSFIGQVPVKVRGVVNSGDLIIASGRNDGTAIAISPAGVASLDRAQIIGRAWQSSNEPELKKVMVAVGLDRSEVAMAQFRQLKTTVQRQQQEILALKTSLSRYENLAARVEALQTRLDEQQPLVADNP